AWHLYSCCRGIAWKPAFDGGWLFNLWRDPANEPALWQVSSHPWLAIALTLFALCAACGLLPSGARSRLMLL
ncbi:hypothetical protein, partial [Type-E symbiont of Plautia stali]|uniref:hypothetical protein n=1 Tax=Type-E symbiont of Plautia stali TaxID=1560357 RepID=UPI001428A2CA